MEPSKDVSHLSAVQRYLEPSERVDSDAEYHQKLLQQPRYSSYPMSDYTNFNNQRTNRFLEVIDSSSIENGANVLQNSTRGFFDCCENGSNPPANENNPHKTPSPKTATDQLSPYQQPLLRPNDLSSSQVQARMPFDLNLQTKQEVQQQVLEDQCQIQHGEQQKSHPIASPRGPISLGAVETVESTKSYWCPECDFSTTFETGLFRHQTRVHSGRDVSCTKCGCKFLSQRALDKHSKIHDMRNRRFKCRKCGKKFYHKKGLRKHVVIHMENPPYECDVCQKRYVYKSYMLQHKQSHEGHETKLQKKTKKD